MRSTGRGWTTAALAVALVSGAFGALAAPASTAAAGGGCSGNEGVTVVVDFGTLAGGTQTRCAPEPVSSGFDALTRAGFTYEGTARFPGLLCRIDGKPAPAQDACQNAPSATFYWAYWTAPEPGGAWTYSDTGAGNRDPAPGSVEGWAFSDGCKRQPGAATTCSSTTTTHPPTTSTATPAAPSAATGATGRSRTADPAAPGQAPVAPSTVGPAVVPGTADPAGVTTTDHDGPEGRDDAVALDARRDAVASSPADRGGGSPAGVLVGLAVVSAFGVAGVQRARRRRSGALAGPGVE